MTTDQPDPPLPERNTFLHNAALAGVVICPLAMALPPRKMDARFAVLMGSFSLSGNYLAYVYTGQSLYTRFQNRLSSWGQVLPPEAQRTQQLLREHKQQQLQQQQQQQDKHKGLAKVVDDVWMGGEDKDWQKKRLEEHKKSFEEGKGMGDIIMDQVADVWSGNWKPSSKKQDGELNAADTNPPEKK